MKKKCVICQDAYGTRYICNTCRKDPANKGWIETAGRHGEREVAVADYRETDTPAVFDGAKRDDGFTDTERAVAYGLLLGNSNADIARTLELSRERVRQIRDKLLNGKDVDVTQPNFAWMTEESQRIVSAIGQNLDDSEIAGSLDVDIAHVQRMRAFLEKASRRLPYDE